MEQFANIRDLCHQRVEKRKIMVHSIPADVLKHVRDASGMSQATLARAMNTVPSVLSKLEKADEVEPEIAERYLAAIGTQTAAEVSEHYARNWLRAKPPSFLHPDREALWTIDRAARDLLAFQGEMTDPILRGPIDLLRNELQITEAYLDRRDHIMAWVGDIGVGKTMALTYAVGLLVGDGRSGRRPAFPVGPGRTTVCETAIRVAPTFGVLVDTVTEEEVVRLTKQFVASLAPGASGGGLSAELGRLIRNMAGMKPVSHMENDEPITKDPIVDLLKEGLGIDEVTDRIVGGMSLAARKERQMILPEGREDGLLWVSNLVSAINSGAEPRFSIPRRITVLMPSDNLSADGQTLSVIDTRGVEGVTQRPDITTYAEDSRTLLVLCTKFADAPNTTVQRHLQESQDAASDAAERYRQCILVLPRGDEALEMPGLDGPVISRQQGYGLRRKEIEQALANVGLPPTPVYFFDAKNDDAGKIWTALRGQIARMRAAYAARGVNAADGVRNLIENVDVVRTSEARREIEQDLARVLHAVGDLPETVRPAYQNLIDQLAVGHHSSIAASIYRRGDWENFQVDHILGTGVRVDANLRSRALVQRIEHKLMDLESKYEDLEAIGQNLRALRARLSESRQEFLAAARTIGRDAYGELLSDADIWTQTAERYGQGAGYKRDITAAWRNWFETTEGVRQTASKVSERLQDAWSVWVLEPLMRATRVQPDSEPGGA
ncbi:helix-turn-helix domain-containing protein [Mesorhizobium sp. PL10]